MRCEVCGAALTATKTDLPFKVRESGIVVFQGLPVLQCTSCPRLGRWRTIAEPPTGADRLRRPLNRIVRQHRRGRERRGSRGQVGDDAAASGPSRAVDGARGRDHGDR